MEKLINVSRAQSGTYQGNYQLAGFLNRSLLLNINGFVTIHHLILNGGVLVITTPLDIVIGTVINRSTSALFLEAKRIDCPKIDYKDDYISVRNNGANTWNMLKLSDLNATTISFSSNGNLKMHHFIQDSSNPQYIKQLK